MSTTDRVIQFVEGLKTGQARHLLFKLQASLVIQTCRLPQIDHPIRRFKFRRSNFAGRVLDRKRLGTDTRRSTSVTTNRWAENGWSFPRKLLYEGLAKGVTQSIHLRCVGRWKALDPVLLSRSQGRFPAQLLTA